MGVVYIAAADESEQGDRKGEFHYGGFVAPEPFWLETFTPLWEERVLRMPPPIPYMHVVDLRSRKWRERHGLTAYEADLHADAAAKLIGELQQLQVATVNFHGGHFRNVFRENIMLTRTAPPSAHKLEPDYMAFLGFARGVLDYARKDPDAERVDFLVERKRTITHNLHGYIGTLGTSLQNVGCADLVPLIGTLISGDKTSAPLQAADFALWHLRRAEELPKRGDRRRVAMMFDERTLISGTMSRDDISGVGERSKKNQAPNPFKRSSSPR